MSTEHTLHHPRLPAFWLTTAVCIAAVASMAYLRLVYYPNATVPLSSTLPLFITLWSRSKLQLLWMSIALTLISAIKDLFLLTSLDQHGPGEIESFIIRLFSIWSITWLIHIILDARTSLEESNARLELSNADLAASHEELAQQNEELECKSRSLSQLNEAVECRERALQTLLEGTRWDADGSSERMIIDQICKVAVSLMSDRASAAVIFTRCEGRLYARGCSGISGEDKIGEIWANHESLAALVMECGKTGFLNDARLRPDLCMLQAPTGEPFLSVLASPIVMDGATIGAIEVFSSTCTNWEGTHFSAIEWIASQAGLLLGNAQRRKDVEQRKAEAEEASHRKTRFLAAVSHDVRTPANAISLMADVLVKVCESSEGKEDRMREIALNLKASARSLVDLVSDVLDLARFDSGLIDLQPSCFSLNELLYSEVQTITPVAEAKRLKVLLDPITDTFILQTDRVKLSRVIGNLLGNAVKFTEQGHIKLTVTRDTSDGLTISVADTGIGISSEHRAQIFDEFFQLRNPERDSTKGSGLGLAICKRLLNAMGCSITVTSTIGSGSCFAVHIPRSLISLSTISGTSTEEHRTSRKAFKPLTGLRVLIIEDHEVTRSMTSQLLANEGASVSQAPNGSAGLAALACEKPDILLLDLMLPDMDGTEVLRAMRKAGALPTFGTYVISGDVNPIRTAEVKRLGAHDLLAKPVAVETLVEVLSEARSRRSGAYG